MRGSNAFRYNSQFKAWLEKDPRHRVTYDRLVARWDTSYLLKQSDVAKPYLQTPRPRFGGPAWLTPRLAALVLAVAALGMGLLVRVGGPSRGSVLASTIGQRKNLVLADGSRLVLDVDSAVVPQITARVRTVRLLRGRARFTVAAAAAPFVVLAGDAVVTAHGTEFDVDRGGADQIDVVLIQGTVDIARRHRFGFLGPERLIRLSGRQSASFRGSRVSVAPLASPPSARDWTAGPLSFEQAPIGDVLLEANRYSQRKIRFGSPDLARLKITGVLDTGTSPELAEALARTLGLSLATAPNGDLVLSRRAA